MSPVDELGRRLLDVALLEGDFTLRSGKRSRWYLDKYRFETDPAILRELGERLAAAIREAEPETVRVAGPALGAVALAASAAMASGLPFIIVRGETKEYATGNRIEGPYEPGELVCLVEDVVTSGGALCEAVEAVRAAGLVVRHAVCVVDREEGGADALARLGVRLAALYRAGELLAEREPRDEPAWLSRIRVGYRLVRGHRETIDQGGSNVTKQEFVDAVADKAGMTKRDAGSAVDAALDVIEGTLRNGDAITFTGFGKFHVTRRAARQGVNPRTGEPVQIAAANVPKFSRRFAAQEGRQLIHLRTGNPPSRISRPRPASRRADP